MLRREGLKIGIIGAGNIGSGLGTLLTGAGHSQDKALLSQFDRQRKTMEQAHCHYISQIQGHAYTLTRGER